MSGSHPHALPIDPRIVEHRTHIAAVLVFWALLLAEERRIHAPAHGDPTTVAGWLAVHLRWAAAQPWIEDYAAKIDQLRSRANALLYPSGRRRIVIGPCPHPACPGALVATVTRADDLLPCSVDCDHEPEHTWTPDRWVKLGRLMGAT